MKPHRDDGGATRPFLRVGCVKEVHRDPIVGPHHKALARDQRWKSRAKCGIIHGGELDPVVDDCGHCKKYPPSVLSYIRKRTKSKILNQHPPPHHGGTVSASLPYQ